MTDKLSLTTLFENFWPLKILIRRWGDCPLFFFVFQSLSQENCPRRATLDRFLNIDSDFNLRSILLNDFGMEWVEWKTQKSSFKSVGGAAMKTILPKSMIRNDGGVAMKMKLIPCARDDGGVAENKYWIKKLLITNFKLPQKFPYFPCNKSFSNESR